MQNYMMLSEGGLFPEWDREQVHSKHTDRRERAARLGRHGIADCPDRCRASLPGSVPLSHRAGSRSRRLACRLPAQIPTAAGGGPHYIIDAVTGAIATKRYEQ